MAINCTRISLPRGASSLRQLSQSATHLLRLDASGPALLIDLSGKKPVAHELPTTIIPGKGSEPDTGLTLSSGAFSADGARMVLLRSGTDQKGGRLPSVELVDTHTRQLLGSFELKKVTKPYGVSLHPDGERVYVTGTPETVVFSLKGKELERISTPHGFELSPSGSHQLIELDDHQFVIRPGKAKFEGWDCTTWADDKTIVTTEWAENEKVTVHRVDAATGKRKQLALIPRTSALAAYGNTAIATVSSGKKVEVFIIDLTSGNTQRFELVGSPSGTCATIGPSGGFVAVNWQKVVHVFSDGKTASKPAPPKKTAPLPAGHAALIARVEDKAKAVGVKLAKGASEKTIAATEKALGVTFPDEVKAFYRVHDGSEDDGAVENRELLSLERIVSEWKIWKGLLDNGDFGDNDHGEPDKGVQKKWWIPQWVPMTYDGSGNHHVLDLAPSKGGAVGQILSFWHDDAPRTVEGKDFLSWLASAEWGDPDRVEEAEESAQSGDFVRYEMAAKFWAVRLDGTSFTVRFGKQGTDGQEQVKSFSDAATTKKELEKLVASKVKKGYRAV